MGRHPGEFRVTNLGIPSTGARARIHDRLRARTPPPDLAITSVKATPAIVFKHGYANNRCSRTGQQPPGRPNQNHGRFSAPRSCPRDRPLKSSWIDGVNQPPPRTIPVAWTGPPPELTVSGSDGQNRRPDQGSLSGQQHPAGRVHVGSLPAKVLLIDGEPAGKCHSADRTGAPTHQWRQKRGFDQPRLKIVREDELSALKLPDLRLPGPEDCPARLHHPGRRRPSSCRLKSAFGWRSSWPSAAARWSSLRASVHALGFRARETRSSACCPSPAPRFTRSRRQSPDRKRLKIALTGAGPANRFPPPGQRSGPERQSAGPIAAHYWRSSASPRKGPRCWLMFRESTEAGPSKNGTTR